MEQQRNYEQTLAYLYEQLPMFSRIGKAAIKKDLVNIRKLCDALGAPQDKFRSVHIAGTNGKGSTSHMLAAILQQAGHKTGLYTSPHLIDFRERIRIDGKPVSEQWVIDFVQQHQALMDDIKPSFFEITVAMAFAAFAESKIDIAVIETGLGGRLDSTNIITPILSIITNISYDHQDMLGDTLPQIAMEKAGIIKHKVPVVIGEQHPETERVFFEQALRQQSPIYYAEAVWDLVATTHDHKYQRYKLVNRAKKEITHLATDLFGSYQQHNIKTVLTATEILSTTFDRHLSLETAVKALQKVKALTGLHGRWEIIHEKPLVITDVAHNPAGIKEVMQQWQQVPARQKHIVAGFVKDKDISAALAHFPADSKYYFCNAQLPRALPAGELKAIAAENGLIGDAYSSVAAAVKEAMGNMTEEDALLVTGSFFVVGEALTAFAK